MRADQLRGNGNGRDDRGGGGTIVVVVVVIVIFVAPKCPFANEAECAYAECCLNQNAQEEYGVTLGLIKEG